MANKQLNFRAPQITRDQLAELEKRTGQTQTQILIMAIDRFFNQPSPGTLAGVDAWHIKKGAK